MAAVMLGADSIQQALIVVVLENPIPQGIGQLLFQFLTIRLELFRGQIAACVPQRDPFPEKSV